MNLQAKRSILPFRFTKGIGAFLETELKQLIFFLPLQAVKSGTELNLTSSTMPTKQLIKFRFESCTNQICAAYSATRKTK